MPTLIQTTQMATTSQNLRPQMGDQVSFSDKEVESLSEPASEFARQS